MNAKVNREQAYGRLVKFKLRYLALSALLCVAPASGHASTVTSTPQPAPLVPGGTVDPIPGFGSPFNLLAEQTYTFGGAGPGPSGSLEEIIGTPFVGPGSWPPGVYEADPYGPKGVFFSFQVEDLTAGNVASIEIPGFSGYRTSVKTCQLANCIFGTGVVPTSASRDTHGDVTFKFSSSVISTSGGFTIYTNATSYADPMPPITLFDVNGNSSTISGTFVPAGPVTPLPPTWTAMLTGLAALALFARRSRKKAWAAAAA
ncbi:MAG TPA: hypothetical protein VKW08_18685 [Xanthobacteraceae bacterium]|nr:hypothetical protein [Xanthobacteraceae bacterium]